MSDALRFARTRPAYTLALLVALCAPALLACLPLDRALAALLDLRPAARGLVAGDDGLWLELRASAPTLLGTALGSTLATLCLGIPAAWIVAAFTAAGAQTSTLPASLIAARGLAVSLVVLPLRALPIGAAALIALDLGAAQTYPTAARIVVTAALVYVLGSSLLTVVTDFARGVALREPARPLVSCLGVGLRLAWTARTLALRCLALELALSLLTFGAIACTRPLGIFGALTYALGAMALVLRAFGSTALVAAAATA